MKKLIMIMVAMPIVAFATTLSDGLVAYYKFDGSLADSSGHEYTLHSNKAESYTTDRFGEGNSAYWLDGDAWLYKTVAGEKPIAWGTNYTFACWFKASEETALTAVASSGISGLSSSVKYILGDTDMPIAIGSNGINVFEHGDYYLPARVRYDGNIGTTWHHMAITVANNQKVVVYLDGCQIGAFSMASRAFVSRLGLGRYGDYYTGIGAFCYGGKIQGRCG